MARYDFKSLSHQDFEELIRDLLQAQWGKTIEAFATGRDQGIDLRYCAVDDGTTIVQCKHRAGSTFSKLLSHLRTSELPKVKDLAPSRYLVVTSLGLSPAQKDKIVACMSPFILNASDVLGADDIDSLLARYPDIERSNFKLWLTSTSVIARILHNAEICQAKFEVDRIRKKLPVFVQNTAYPRANQILSDHQVVIISGVPGIGKTTLAEMLLYAHLDDGYEPVVIQRDISEGKKLFREDSKQIFYYDDFLGQTFLGDQRSYLGHNQDVALIAFMELVRSTPHSRFVLTTREHILRQAFLASEKFEQSTLLDHKCVLELGDYSLGQRARILYNHIYFSTLPQAYKDVILEDDFFLDVINHTHFNPRLIEWISSLSRLQSPPVHKYQKSINDLFDSPEKIWSYAFETQISDAARDLLLTVYTLGEWVSLEQLGPAFEAIYRGACARCNRKRSITDLHSALEELDGAFLHYRYGLALFINPSIRDFTSGFFCRFPNILLEMLPDLIRFRQLSNIWRLATEHHDQPLMAMLLQNIETWHAHAERLVYRDSLIWMNGGRDAKIIDMGEDARLTEIAQFAEKSHHLSFITLAEKYAEHLPSIRKNRSINFGDTIDTLNAIHTMTWFWHNGGDSIYRVVLDEMLGYLSRAGSEDWIKLFNFADSIQTWSRDDDCTFREAFEKYQMYGLDAERERCTKLDDLEEMHRSLEELVERYSVDFTRALLSIADEITEREERQRHFDDAKGAGFVNESSPVRVDPMNEDEVRQMFQTLRE